MERLGSGGRRPPRFGEALKGLLCGLALTGALALFLPASGVAAMSTFGSSLSVPATLNTAENLAYQGQHAGTDTALWNATQASGVPQAPESGQALKVALEGCAMPAAGGPAPLTQIHFQALTPLAGGGATVDLTSQAFSIPVCGQEGAGPSTVTAYEPTNLCVEQGQVVDFNDEGGFVAGSYPEGVPYEVIGARAGATLDSFVKSAGTDNGATMAASTSSATEGFAASANEELMLQVTLATGTNASPACGGSGASTAQGGAGAKARPALRINRQTDGVNHLGVVEVALFCALKPACKGVANLSVDGKPAGTHKVGFDVAQDSTGHVAVRLLGHALRMLDERRALVATVTAVVDGQHVKQTVEIKIL